MESVSTVNFEDLFGKLTDFLKKNREKLKLQIMKNFRQNKTPFFRLFTRASRLSVRGFGRETRLWSRPTATSRSVYSIDQPTASRVSIEQVSRHK